MTPEATLVNYRIDEVKFVNKLNAPAKLELNYKYSYNVGYSQQNTCRATLGVEITDKLHPETFSLTMAVAGVFSTAPGIAKEVLHLKTYDLLFPYAKALVSSFTATAAIPPIYIPYIDISKKSIYKMEMPRPEGPKNE